MSTMTKDKAQKRAVRARMDKTGERYTTARHFLLDLHHSEQSGDLAPPTGDAFAVEAIPSLVEQTVAASHTESTPEVAPAANPPRVVDLGFTEAAMLKATGKGWEEWFALLDAWEGTTRTHAEIARHVHESYGIDGWWAQSVTVGYERARGMRAKHERPDGFSMSASKTFPVPVERLFAAFVDPDERHRWLDAVDLRHRTSQANKSARFDVLPGATRLAAWFTAKGERKATIQLQHERLDAAEDVARWKALWKAQLALLATYLTDGSADSN